MMPEPGRRGKAVGIESSNEAATGQNRVPLADPNDMVAESAT